MKNLSVRTKLFSGFAIVLLFSIIIAVLGIFGFNMLRESIESIDSAIKPIESLSNASNLLYEIRLNTYTFPIVREDEGGLLNDEFQKTRDNISSFVSEMESYSTSIVTDTGKVLYNELMEAFSNELVPSVENLQELVLSDISEEELLLAVEEANSSTSKIEEDIKALFPARMEAISTEKNTANNIQLTLVSVAIVVLIAVIIISIILCLYISGLITKPLKALSSFMKKASTTGNIKLTQEDEVVIAKFSRQNDEIGETIKSTADFLQYISEVSEVLTKISEKDLAVNPKSKSNEDTLGTSLEVMVNVLKKMLGDLTQATLQVDQGARQIASGAQALAQGTAEQSATVQEVSVAVTEITSKTKQNADLAHQAKLLGEEISVNAEKGNSQMEELVLSVNTINNFSEKIAGVVKVIDDIAFQINILALNASVEAARAGQHGKGFAVVADEVRNLATKSAAAAADTSVLITDSLHKAQDSKNLASETEESLLQIVHSISEMTKLIDNVATSSSLELNDITQISTAMDQVAQVVQQNSASAEESAAAAQEMSGQSAILNEMARQFILNPVA